MCITLAPRGSGIARLAAALERDPRLVEGLRLASPERLSAYVRRIGATELAREAALGLLSRRPDLSAAERGSQSLRVFAGLIAAAALVLGLVSPASLLLATEGFLGTAFLAWIGLRLRACFVRPDKIEPLRVPERALPVYTIVVPLYREARIVPRLVAALRRFDYPLEKLDIKLVVEADDADTRYAIARLRLGAPFEEIVAPLAGPRTKPKALAAALPFARGSFLVVYDAEDEPDSDQLREALAAFRGASQSLACVQARLTIDNASDNWITRQYAAEYAALFDVFLPSLARMRLPIPLGGTSNHFRTEISAPRRRLGPVQRHRGHRYRHPSGSLRLSHRHHRLHHLRGSTGKVHAVAAAAYPLVQGLDSDLPRAHARAAAPDARTGSARIPRVPAAGRRHGARGARASVLSRPGPL